MKCSRRDESKYRQRIGDYKSILKAAEIGREGARLREITLVESALACLCSDGRDRHICSALKTVCTDVMLTGLPLQVASMNTPFSRAEGK
uniref:Transcriptional regulator n=1 Tax=Ascaris lumbricoides TaxID=6252 RepID=A0A0M3I4U6_ASCLU